MAEAARRLRETGESNVVRRLIARPIRLDLPRMPARTSFAPIVSERSEDRPDAFEAARIEDDAFEDEPEEDGVVERLQTEMAVMKAILMAERAEAASLRAQIDRQFEQRFEPVPVGPEARATRDRWAAMVDRLLQSPR